MSVPGASRRRDVRPVAVVSFAQSPSVRREDHRNEVEMLMPVVTEVFANVGVTKNDMGFVCSGSSDYLVGAPFSFVMALDAVGVWPPHAREPRRDGRGLGPVRGVDAAAGGRHRHRPRLQLRPLLPERPAARPGAAARPLLHGAPVARCRGARRPAGASARRPGQGHRGRLRRRGRPQPARRSREPQRPGGQGPDARGLARGRLRGGTPAAPRPAAHHRRRGRRGAGGGGAGHRAVRTPGVDHGHGPPHRDARTRGAGPHGVDVHQAGRPGGRSGRRGRDRGGRAARPLRPPGAHLARGARAR